ncbi:hypothetical protein [Mucilaginibacter sp.]|uniref:hypothetical protein n=1 Tax=Mucilaginibacter sp. TaxID=1882438 RepID=UPI002628C13E|nr:hypothetical protein [Mucilaginibacter sp.]
MMRFKSLRKAWVRVIISLAAGGVINEIVFLFFDDDPYRHRLPDEPNYTILYAVFIYLILTGTIKHLDRIEQS